MEHKQEEERSEQHILQKSREEGVLKRNRELFQMLAPGDKTIAMGQQGIISDPWKHLLQPGVDSRQARQCRW